MKAKSTSSKKDRSKRTKHAEKPAAGNYSLLEWSIESIKRQHPKLVFKNLMSDNVQAYLSQLPQ